MSITTFTSSEFNQNTSRAKKAAAVGPVFITHRGRPAYVLLSIEGYRRLAGSDRSIVDALAMDDEAEFDLPRSSIVLTPSDFIDIPNLRRRLQSNVLGATVVSLIDPLEDLNGHC